MYGVNRREVAFVYELCPPFWFDIYSFSCFDLLTHVVYYSMRTAGSLCIKLTQWFLEDDTAFGSQ